VYGSSSTNPEKDFSWTMAMKSRAKLIAICKNGVWLWWRLQQVALWSKI
jgi:hypothetical protein